jgi:squalene-hopene/tetraprenyl-beta-curcumene cyclase
VRATLEIKALRGKEVMNRIIFVVAIALGAAGCGTAPGPSGPEACESKVERIDRALAHAAEFLAQKQCEDGGWRSEKYGPFKDGGSLTPPVLNALLRVPLARESFACKKGLDYLTRLVRPDGSVDEGPHGLSYPVYTAALAVIVLSRPDQVALAKARAGWLAYLKARQLTEPLGWSPTDRPYGGWGFSSGLPRKPNPKEEPPALTESNLSATVFALEALRAAGVSASDPALQKALVFVQRCQNCTASAPAADAKFDDGGFFFIYDDAARNKAGAAGTDSAGRQRFRSYGSTTADGLRSLVLCGLAPDHPRVAAARHWLQTNFRADHHPGAYRQDREPNRDAVYYYYCYSVAQALGLLDHGDQKPDEADSRALALVDALLERQHPDGSWENPAVAVREDDPLVATSLAACALASCRDTLARLGP